jgi:hypothetical protein
MTNGFFTVLEHTRHSCVSPTCLSKPDLAPPPVALARAGVLLHGPPGSGKTHLVRCLAAEGGVALVAVNGAECASGEAAEGKLRRAFAAAREQAPAILFIDDLDALAPSRDASPSADERQSASRLLCMLDDLRRSGAAVAVIAGGRSPSGLWIAGCITCVLHCKLNSASRSPSHSKRAHSCTIPPLFIATNRKASIEPSLRRPGRLDLELRCGPLSDEDRIEVLRACAAGMPLCPTVDLAAVAVGLRGFMAADVGAVCLEAALRCAVHAVEAVEAAGLGEEALADAGWLEGLEVGVAHFEEAAAAVAPSLLRELAGPEVPEVCGVCGGGERQAQALAALAHPRVLLEMEMHLASSSHLHRMPPHPPCPPHRCPGPMLGAWGRPSVRCRRLWSSRSAIQPSCVASVCPPPGVPCSTALRGVARRYWPRRLRGSVGPTSSQCVGPSCCRSGWARARRLCGSCSRLHGAMLRLAPLCMLRCACLPTCHLLSATGLHAAMPARHPPSMRWHGAV